MSRVLLPLVALAALALQIQPRSPAFAGDILGNGGFEQITAAGQLAPWTRLGCELTRVSPPAPVFAGSFAARVVQTAPGPRVQQLVPVVAGSSYALQGSIWLGTIPGAKLRLEFHQAAGETLAAEESAILTALGAWEPLGLSATAPVGSSYAAVVVLPVSGVTGQELYLDNFSLQETLPPPSPSPQPTTAVPPSITPQPSSTTGPPETPAPPPSPTLPADASPTPGAAGADDGSGGMLLNGGFERSSGGAPTDWRKYGGDLSSSGDRVRSGERSALLSSGTDSTKWLWQPAAVGAGGWYEFSAFGWSDGGDWFLRVSWYASADATGSAIASTDAAQVVGPGGGFEPLSTGPVQAPEGALAARARIMFRPSSAASAALYVDDARMEPSAPPPPGVTPAAAVEEPPAEADPGTAAGEQDARQAQVPTARPPGAGASPAAPGTPRPTATLFSQVLAADERDADRDGEASAATGGGSPPWVWAIPAAGLAAAAGGGVVYAWQRRRRA